jgi:hypothetical protein
MNHWSRAHDNGWPAVVGSLPDGSYFATIHAPDNSIHVPNNHATAELAREDADGAVRTRSGHTCSDKCGSWRE